jgi:hypothetical protein
MCKESLTGYYVALSDETEQSRREEHQVSRMKEPSSVQQQLENRFVNERAVHPRMMTSVELHNSLFTLT